MVVLLALFVFLVWGGGSGLTVRVAFCSMTKRVHGSSLAGFCGRDRNPLFGDKRKERDERRAGFHDHGRRDQE